MKIKVDAKAFLMCFLELLCKFKQIVYLGKCKFSHLIECPIEILAKQTSSIVASNYSIGVSHWYYIENVFASNFLCEGVIAANKLKEALNNKGRIRFSWVNSGCDQGNFLIAFINFLVCYL